MMAKRHSDQQLTRCRVTHLQVKAAAVATRVMAEQRGTPAQSPSISVTRSGTTINVRPRDSPAHLISYDLPTDTVQSHLHCDRPRCPASDAEANIRTLWAAATDFEARGHIADISHQWRPHPWPSAACARTAIVRQSDVHPPYAPCHSMVKAARRSASQLLPASCGETTSPPCRSLSQYRI